MLSPFSIRSIFALMLFCVPLSGTVGAAEGTVGNPTTSAAASDAEVNAQIKKWLPRSYAKLILRRDQELRVVILGDSIGNFQQGNPAESFAVQHAWHWRFLEKMAGHFFFTGGVKLGDQRIKKKSTKPGTAITSNDEDSGPRSADPLDADTAGSSIMVENLSRNGAVSVQAMEALSTSAFDNDPDLVIAMYGMNDAMQGGSLKTYREALEHTVSVCKTRGVDLILAGPPLITGADERKFLGLSRPYSSVAEEVAEKGSVLFVDAGSAQAALAVDPSQPRSLEGSAKVMRHIRGQYFQQGAVDGVHPTASGHQLIADGAWGALTTVSPVEPVAVTASFVLPNSPNQDAKLQLKFSSLGGEEDGLQAIAIGALSMDRIWVPRSDLSAEEISAGMSNADVARNRVANWFVTIPCRPVLPQGLQMLNRGDLPFGEEPFIRGSLIVSEGAKTRLVDFKAPITPISVNFPLGRMEGLRDQLTLPVVVTNAAATPFSGTAEIVWQGKTESIPVNIPANSPTTLPLKLSIPTDSDPKQFKSQLTVRMLQDGATYSFHREIELAPDLIQNKRMELRHRATYAADRPATPVTDESNVGIMSQADSNGLYLVLDLPPAVSNQSKTQPSAVVQISIDARGPEHRGKTGYTDPLTLNVPWQDGRFQVSKLFPGLFGDGYDRVLDPEYFLASLTTLSDNRRRVRVSIPRVYFYLHQWSLAESGQNSLGINAQVSLIEFTSANPAGAFPLEKIYTLVSPGITRFDTTGLGVFNLSSKSPSWSARIY